MNRKAALAKIHIGKKALGWDEDTYRLVLHRRYGVESAGKLKDGDLADLCEHFKSQGVVYKRPKKQPARDRKHFYRIPSKTPHASQKRYICALWAKLGYDMDKLDTRVKKQFNVAKLVWLHNQADLQTLAKDLWNRCKNKGLNPEPYQW
jgi:phage gp16-like protein